MLKKEKEKKEKEEMTISAFRPRNDLQSFRSSLRITRVTKKGCNNYSTITIIKLSFHVPSFRIQERKKENRNEAKERVET